MPLYGKMQVSGNPYSRTFYVVKAIRKTSKKNFVFYPTLLPFLLMKYFEVLSYHPNIFLNFQISLPPLLIVIFLLTQMLL